MIPYKIRKYWDELRWWWNPRQKWLIKKIPNHWVDKDYLWEICILEGIKHYVEQDGGLDFNNYVSNQTDASYPEWQKKFDKEVKTMYDYITVILPILNKELEDAWKKDKLNEVLGLEKLGVNITPHEKVSAGYKNLNLNDQGKIDELFQLAFKNILINPKMGLIGNAAKKATPEEKYELLKQYVAGGGGTLRVDKAGKLIYASKQFQDKGIMPPKGGGSTGIPGI